MRSHALPSIALLGALILAALAYLQGLGGAFMVDDFPNLEDLSLISEDPGISSYLRFVTSGISSEVGRPLSLLSFALQHHSWPGAPGDFIFVNVLLHLFNGCLVFILCRQLLTILGHVGVTSDWIAIGAMFFWLLASPQAGAVLYVIQRMALLGGTFMLLGLVLYLAGRKLESRGRWTQGFALMLSGLLVGVPVGILAKESVAILPVLVLVLEITVLQGLPRSRAWKAFAGVCVLLPAALLAAYLASFIPDASSRFAFRPFTLSERLLTEARVLFMYLHKALVPSLTGIRLYYDDLPLSRSLLQPWTTLASVAGWIALTALAVRLRRAAPLFAFAVLGFLASHLIESTVIPLEIAFDHRNYIGLVGIGLALVWYGGQLLQWQQFPRVRWLAASAAAIYGAFLLVGAWQTSALWGRPWELAHFWALKQPESRRAQQSAIRVYWHYARPAEAAAAAERALERWPGDVSYFLAMLEVACAFPTAADAPSLDRVPGIVAQYDSTVTAVIPRLDTLVTWAENRTCTRFSPSDLWVLTQMTFDTPKLVGEARNRDLLLMRIAELAQDRSLARQLLQQALAKGDPSPYMLYRATAWALEDGDLQCADMHLRQFENLGRNPANEWAFRREFTELRKLRAQLGARPEPALRTLGCTDPRQEPSA